MAFAVRVGRPETKWIDEVSCACQLNFLLFEGIISWLLPNFYDGFHFFKGVSVFLCLSISTLCICFLTLAADSPFHFPVICLSLSHLLEVTQRNTFFVQISRLCISVALFELSLYLYFLPILSFSNYSYSLHTPYWKLISVSNFCWSLSHL